MPASAKKAGLAREPAESHEAVAQLYGVNRRRNRIAAPTMRRAASSASVAVAELSALHHRPMARKRKPGSRTKSGRLSRAGHVQLRDHGTREGQRQRSALIDGAPRVSRKCIRNSVCQRPS